MNEYDPNRWECCDSRLPSKFNYCPNCGEIIPKRPDTAHDIAERKRLANLRGASTRLQSLRMELLRIVGRTKQEIEEYNEHCYPWTHERQIAAIRKDITAYEMLVAVRN